MDQVVLTKAGPRLISLCREGNSLSIIVNGPRMLFEKLELLTNRSGVDGATVPFYESLRDGLEATIACPHEPIRPAVISVEPHRVGAELSIELGPMSMYQSELVLRTRNRESFRELLERSLGAGPEGFSSEGELVAVLMAVRATGHHEHHSSARSALDNNAADHSEHGAHH